MTDPTIPTAVFDDRDRFTVWGNPNETLKSQYGEIPHLTWCIEEVKRLKRMGKRAQVVSCMCAGKQSVAVAHM